MCCRVCCCVLLCVLRVLDRLPLDPPSAGPPCAVCVCVCCVCVVQDLCAPDPRPSAGPPKISLFFFPFSRHNFHFFLSLVSSRVFLVVFWSVGTSNVLVFPQAVL